MSANITNEHGVAGLVGSVFGETTPSVTNVEVIGEILDDYAINVHFNELDTSYWFAPDLLEFVDHSPGTTVSIDGIEKEWVRSESGEWIEHTGSPQRPPWWKFW